MKQLIRSDGNKFILHDEKRVHFQFPQDILKQKAIPHDPFEGIALDSAFHPAQPDANYVHTTDHDEAPHKNEDPFASIEMEAFSALRDVTRHITAQDFEEIEQDFEEIEQDFEEIEQDFEEIKPDFSNEKPFQQIDDNDSWKDDIVTREDQRIYIIEDGEYHAALALS